MQKLLVAVGGLLSLLAVGSFALSGFDSITALIPLVVGLPMAGCGVLAARQPAKADLYLRIGAGLGLLGFLAAASRIPALAGAGANKSVSVWAMCVLCLAVVIGFVASLVGARSGARD